MNLAVRDVRRHVARFVGTAVGLGLLLSVVIAMQGIYAGMVDDATILTRAMGAELWLVQRDTRGPFAEASRLDPSVEHRAAALPGVRGARAYTYQLIQREHRGATLRLALVGLAWPDDRGAALPLVRGRPLAQPHGELVVDASLGLDLGEVVRLADEDYRIVGLTRNALTSGGDAVAFMTVADTHLVALEQPAEAVVLERQRVVARLADTDLGRAQPNLAELPMDPRWRPPAFASPPVAAVLLDVDPHRVDEVRAAVRGWADVTVYTQAEEQALLLGGVLQRARMQIGLFTVILTLTAAVIVMMVIYNLTLEKTHDLAILKLMGAQRRRLLGFVLQQAWLLGAVGYLVAYVIRTAAYDRFPRRVLITDAIATAAPLLTLVIVTLASIVGVVHVSRVDPGRALEG